MASSAGSYGVMSRVPDFPSKPTKLIVTVGDPVVRSFCSGTAMWSTWWLFRNRRGRLPSSTTRSSSL